MRDGIVSSDLPSIEWVAEQLERVFGPCQDGRLGVVSLEDDTVYWTVSTARYVMITGAELASVAAYLDVEMRAIQFEDSPPNAIRFQACLARDTRPECIAAIEGRRP